MEEKSKPQRNSHHRSAESRLHNLLCRSLWAIAKLQRTALCSARSTPDRFRKSQKGEPASGPRGVRIGRILGAMDRNLSKIKAEPK